MADEGNKPLIDSIGDAFGNREWHPGGPIQVIFEILIVVVILYGILRVVERVLGYGQGAAQALTHSTQGVFVGPWATFLVWLPFIQALSLLFSIVLFIGIVHFSRKTTQIHDELGAPLYPAQVAESEKDAHNDEHIVNEKWQRIQEHINSEHPSDWRFAIIEADIMLDEMLDKLEYHGETMNEKLKQIERSDFRTIDFAWEAHKVRNQIAHEGSEFLINEREARRVVGLYQQVFEEFKYI